MYTSDIVSLREFYATPIGRAVCSLITRAIADLWPQAAKEEILLGIGYATPYLQEDEAEGMRAIACMPAQQGASYWPASQASRVFLSHEAELPLPENSVNRILLLHSVENTEQLSAMIDDVWRVLTPGGRVLAVVPSRMGGWSRSSLSPFGNGRPFSMAQLRELMTSHQFTLMRSASALFIPPTRWRMLWRFAHAIESAGQWLCPFLGGVLLVEAEKQLYASVMQPVAVRKGYRIPIPANEPAMGLK